MQGAESERGLRVSRVNNDTQTSFWLQLCGREKTGQKMSENNEHEPLGPQLHRKQCNNGERSCNGGNETGATVATRRAPYWQSTAAIPTERTHSGLTASGESTTDVTRRATQQEATNAGADDWPFPTSAASTTRTHTKRKAESKGARSKPCLRGALQLTSDQREGRHNHANLLPSECTSNTRETKTRKPLVVTELSTQGRTCSGGSKQRRAKLTLAGGFTELFKGPKHHHGVKQHDLSTEGTRGAPQGGRGSVLKRQKTGGEG